MEKNAFMSAAKKARIALAVMAVCGMSFAGGERAFAENVTIDQDKNIICGDGATAKKNPNSTEEGTGMIVIGNMQQLQDLILLPLVLMPWLQATVLQ